MKITIDGADILPYIPETTDIEELSAILFKAVYGLAHGIHKASGRAIGVGTMTITARAGQHCFIDIELTGTIKGDVVEAT